MLFGMTVVAMFITLFKASKSILSSVVTSLDETVKSNNPSVFAQPEENKQKFSK